MPAADSSEKPTRILILGGGFAGTNALIALQKKFRADPTVEIAMVSRENYCLFTPMLSEVAIGTVDPRHIVIPIRELCHQAVFYRGEVVGIDLNTQTVDILYNQIPHCPARLHYDHLILAMGSTSNTMLVPGVSEIALQFKDIGDALFLRNHLLEMFERADVCRDPFQRQTMLNFTVIGGSYSGVEIAAAICNLAERIRPLYPSIRAEEIRVQIIEAQNRLLSNLPEALSQYAMAQLETMGIRIQLETRLSQVEPGLITLHNGEHIATHTAVWTTGITLPPLIQSLPVQKDTKNRPLNTMFLHLPQYPNVWAIGDNIVTPLPDLSGSYTATAQVAVRQGRHAAHNIHRVINNKPPEAFTFKPIGEMVVLGERSAIAIIGGLKLKGFVAWLLWRGFYLMQLPRWKKRLRVASDWLLDLFGPAETTQIKPLQRREPCDMAQTPSAQEYKAAS